MNAARLSRLGHRTLAVIVGLQLVVWTMSGLYMVAVDLDFIHGDTLVRNVTLPVRLDTPLASLSRLREGRNDLTRIEVRTLPDSGQTVYEIRRRDRVELLDAATGEPMPAIGEERVRALAAAYYAGDGRLSSVRRLATDPDIPTEIRGRRAPLWRADFDDFTATTLYVDPATGRLVARRHRFWRWFDLLWSLHIMDYVEREDVNNPLLRVATPVALLLASFGLWLAFFSFAFLQRRRRAPRR